MIGCLAVIHVPIPGSRPLARSAFPIKCHRFVTATAPSVTVDNSAATTNSAYVRQVLESGATSKVAAIPETVIRTAVKLWSPASIAPADNALGNGTVRRNNEIRIPSPSTFPATPNCPIPSEISCATKLRDQERPLMLQ